MSTTPSTPAADPAAPGNPPAAPAAAPGAAPAAPAAVTPPANSDPGAAAAPAAPAAAAAPAAPAEPGKANGAQPPSFISMVESIEDPSLKNVASRFTSVQDMAKAVVDLRADNSKRIKVPDENASDEDRAKFRKAIGAPDEVKGYAEAIKLPDGVEMTEADKAVLDAVLPIAHKHGVPAQALNGFVGEYMQLAKKLQGDAMAAIQKFGADSEVALKREWGSDFEPNLALANRVGEVFGGPEFKAFLNETPLATGGMLGDHPLMAKFLATLGKRSGEGELMIGATPEEKTSIQEQIDALNRQVPVGSANYTSAAHQKKLQTLFDKLHGTDPVVGAGI
jgi:hypothetical protein